PKQPIRIQPRVVKRAYSRYDRKKPEHLQAPALDAEFQEIIAVVPCIQGLARIPEMPLLATGKGVSAIRNTGEGESPTPDLLDTSSPTATADISCFPSKPPQGKTSKAREHTKKTGGSKATRAP